MTQNNTLENENKALKEELASHMMKEQLSRVENYRYYILDALERLNSSLEKIEKHLLEQNGQTNSK